MKSQLKANGTNTNPEWRACGFLRIFVSALFLSFAAWSFAQQSYAQTEVDTKGNPIEGDIGSVGKIRFFGEGATKIFLDSEQHLQLWDKDGKPIAGFEAEAVDANKNKITQAYEYWWRYKGKKKKGIYLEHGVVKTAFKGGKMVTTGADTKVLTGYKVKGKRITVTFKVIQNQTDASGRSINKLILTSDDGSKVFHFDIKPNSGMVHLISDNGEFGRFLLSYGEQD